MSSRNWLEELGWTQENLEDLRYTGYSYIRQGKYEIAKPFFEALSVLVPNEIYDIQTLGAIYLELKEPEKAMKYFDQALKLDQTDGPTLLNLSKALFMLKRKDEALKVCRILAKNEDKILSNIAKALLLAYGPAL